MSTAIAINVEPKEDEEVEQTEEPNEENDDEGDEQEEDGDENSVGDEEDPQPPPKPRRKKKRSFNYRPWIIGFVVFLVIGLSIGLGVYFGVVKPKEDPKKPDDPKTTTPIIVTTEQSTVNPHDPKTTTPIVVTTEQSTVNPADHVATTQLVVTTEPSTEIPKDPKETKPPGDDTETTTKEPQKASCYPVQNYAHLEDHFIKPNASSGYKISLFSGQVTHERMFSICDRIDEASRRGSDKETKAKWKGALYFNYPHEEVDIGNIIKKYESRIFDSGVKKLMWTGVSLHWSDTNNRWEGNFQQPHRNFCNNDSLVSDLETKGKSIDKKKDKIYVVKNYENENTCWEIYTAKELATITGQPAGRSPRLPFACSFDHDGIRSGQDAMPGKFTPKYEVGSKYTFYRTSATYEDAKKECQLRDSHLIQFKDEAHMTTLVAEIKNIKPYFVSDLFWSGVYMDVSNGNSGSLTYSPTWKETFVPSGKDGQVMDEPFEKAAEKLIASIKSVEPRDCASHYVYAGMSFEELAPNNRILLRAINAEGQLDKDSFTAYVACEKNLPATLNKN